MTWETKLKDEESLDLLAEIIAHPTRMGFTVEQVCEKFNISGRTFYKKANSAEVQKRVKSIRADRMKWRIAEVDNALLNKALTGYVPAIELIYERWDEFIRRQGLQVEKKDLSVEDLKAREDRIRAYLDRLKAGLNSKDGPNLSDNAVDATLVPQNPENSPSSDSLPKPELEQYNASNEVEGESARMLEESASGPLESGVTRADLSICQNNVNSCKDIQTEQPSGDLPS